jgi:hypothetical protein
MKLIKILLFISSLNLIYALDLSGLNSNQEWKTLQNNDVSIKTTQYLVFPICRAETILSLPLKTISAIIENVENYPNVFLRVTKTRVLEDDVVHIMLDMPFPFSGRDYIIKYIKHKFSSAWTFRFSAVEHVQAPPEKGHVRLIHAAGEWKLTAINDHETNVSYTWNGELLGDFPNWALDRAWKTQGNEMMEWLNDELQD